MQSNLKTRTKELKESGVSLTWQVEPIQRYSNPKEHLSITVTSNGSI